MNIKTIWWKLIATILLLLCCALLGDAQRDTYCPPQEIILPCRCSQHGNEIQIWCSHSDLPRVLNGVKTVSRTLTRAIDELILENNNLPSLPGRSFSPLHVARLMLRHNGLERLSNGWLSDLDDSLVEIFIVERDLRSLPADSLFGLRQLEAVTIQSENLKRVPDFSGLQRLRYINVLSTVLVELSPMGFRDLHSLETIQITGSPELTRLEAGLFHNLPKLNLLNIAENGIGWIHLRALARLPTLRTLELSGNKLSDAGMVGRVVKDLPRLEVIKLDHNQIGILAEGSFVDLPSLRELFLNDNAITEIHHGAFHRTPNLKFVHLENNMLRRVHPESFLQASGSGVEVLHLQHNDISRIEELRSLLDALPMLRFLDLSHNHLEEIPFGALRGHGNIEQLFIDHNNLHLIERDAFMAMPGLRELRLKNNSLSDRLAVPFWNLPGLKGLDLANNEFRRIDQLLLMGLPSLRRLDLSGNALSSLDPSSFTNTPMLETINISSNEIATIHPATFRNLDRLFEIDASYNHLQEMVPGLPRAVERVIVKNNQITALPLTTSKNLDLPNLRLLDISENNLQRLPRAVFKPLSELRILNLAKNQLQAVEEDSFLGLAQLELLNLQENHITILPDRSLATLRQLKDFTVQGNNIEKLGDRLFDSIERLERLDVSRNSISDISPITFRKARFLQYLDLSSNLLKDLPESLTGLGELKEIDVSFNNLTNLQPEIMGSWRKLEELRASNNLVPELRQGSFRNLPQLQYLDLSSNDLRTLEQSCIRNLPELQEIVLADNKLSDLNDRIFEDLPSLQAVHLQQNKLRSISGNTFYRSPSVVYLNLSSNHFRTMDNIGLKSVRNLEVLDLSNNVIRKISTNPLRGMDWLVELKLDDNRICMVQGEPFSSMPRLRVLSMRNNRMSTLPEITFRNLRGNIAILDLDGNPLDCSCDMLWLRGWLEADSSVPGPRCRDGTMLREARLSRNDCQTDSRSNKIPLTNEHGDIFARRLGVEQCDEDGYPDNLHSSLPPSPEESEYFYDQYVDFPLNDTNFTPNSNNLGTRIPPYVHPTTNVNLSNTILNYNQHQAGVIGQQPQYTSPFTFFGVPIPSLGIGKLWGAGRTANTRAATGTRGKGRVQIYRQGDPDIPQFMNRDDELLYRNKRPESDIDATEEKLEIEHRGGEHQLGGYGEPNENQLYYRPYFQTPFREPNMQKGGFIPMLPGLGGFTPINDPYLNRTEKPQLNVTEESHTTKRKWPEEYQEVVPLVTESNNHREHDQSSSEKRIITIPKEETTHASVEPKLSAGFTVLDEHKTTEVYEQKYEEQLVNRPIFTLPPLPTSTTPMSIITASSSNNDISRYEELELGISDKDTETKTTTESIIDFHHSIEIETSSTMPTMPVLQYDFNKKPSEGGSFPAKYDNSWDNANHSPSSLSALVAPGAQQGSYKVPPGRSTITKVFSPMPPILPTAEEYLRPATSMKYNNEIDEPPPNINTNNKPKITHSIQSAETMPKTSNDNMDWYFATYNRTTIVDFDPGIKQRKNSAKQINLPHFSSLVLFIAIYFIF